MIEELVLSQSLVRSLVPQFLDTGGCTMTRATVKSRVTSVINKARDAGPAGIKIIVIGYCMPTMPVGDCSSTATFSELNGGIADAAAAFSDVTYLDGTNGCGGSSSKWSPGTHHQDSIHLNAKGYCVFWSMASTQSALGCAAATYDCSSVAAAAVAGTEGEAKGFAGEADGEETEGDEGELEEGGEEGEGLGEGAYIGIALGAVAALAIVGFGAFKMLCKGTKQGGGAPQGDVEFNIGNHA